jgi:hypothetical protein
MRWQFVACLAPSSGLITFHRNAGLGQRRRVGKAWIVIGAKDVICFPSCSLFANHCVFLKVEA